MSNEGKQVRVHYVGTLDDGTKFDSSRDRGEPLEFVCMAGMMIPGFDAAVRDMEVGQTVTIRLEPADAYGERNDDMVRTFEISQLPGSENLVQGQRIMLAGPYGQPIPALVSEKTDQRVTLDLNHEMAGKALTFEIELLEAVDADDHHCYGGHGHGCCHGEGGHHHEDGECCHGDGEGCCHKDEE
ncbi:MAG: peptidylprolyl isomerase [Atopobiaceae bacterium]|nr:peptidylprolyl isomerase [Atopobiaceae bacterium]